MSTVPLIRVVSDDHLEPLILAFLDDCALTNLSAKTLSFYRTNLLRWHWYCQTFGVVLDPTRMSAAQVRDFLRYVQTADVRWGKPGHNMAGKSAGDSTVHAYFRVLRRFFNWLVEQEYLAESPFANRKIRAPRVRKEQPDPFSRDELGRLARALQGSGDGIFAERDRAIIAVLLDVGLRASEIAAIQVEHISIASGDLYVARGKGGAPRTLRIGARARRQVRRYWLRYRRQFGDSGPLFLSDEHEQLTAQGIHFITTRLGKRAEVFPCNPHRFRHTAAVSAIRAGMGLLQVQAMLGHSSFEMTRRYAKLAEEDLVRASQEHSPLDHLKLSF